MSRLRNTLFIALLLSAIPCLAASPADYGLAMEPVLREALALPDGPATQFASFDIDGKDIFVVLTADFAMGTAKRTPFGTQATKRTRPPESTILNTMKRALTACSSLPAGQGTLYLIIIDRPLFSNPFSANPEQTTYKAWVALRDLTGQDPAGSIRVETAESR